MILKREIPTNQEFSYVDRTINNRNNNASERLCTMSTNQYIKSITVKFWVDIILIKIKDILITVKPYYRKICDWIWTSWNIGNITRVAVSNLHIKLWSCLLPFFLLEGQSLIPELSSITTVSVCVCVFK